MIECDLIVWWEVLEEKWVLLVELDVLLDDLFYWEFLIYVYLCGICFIGYYVVCLFDCNLCILFVIELGLYNLYIMLYWCWIDVCLW